MSHTMILLRHGQSQWNLENRFTGWTDVGLTAQGVAEARTAGTSLIDAGLEPDTAHTSLLIRSILTLQETLEVMGRTWLPVTRSWRLNERHYGALQGLNKAETTDKHGAEQVHIWRRSYDVPPPALDLGDARHPSHDPRYSGLPNDVLPSTESLSLVVDRMLPYWYDVVVPELRCGLTPIISAHGNSLRALVKHLDGISDEVIPSLNIPTGIPLVYNLDADLKVLSSGYLGDPAAVEAAAAAVAAQADAPSAP
jgi:2,3-bisphosphoglycerate-dependent phosphoglycerate mutase